MDIGICVGNVLIIYGGVILYLVINFTISRYYFFVIKRSQIFKEIFVSDDKRWEVGLCVTHFRYIVRFILNVLFLCKYNYYMMSSSLKKN